MTSPEDGEYAELRHPILTSIAWLSALGIVIGSVIPAAGFRLAMVEHTGPIGDWAFGPSDCPSGWYGETADPIRLAAALRNITPGLERDAQASRASGSGAYDSSESAAIWLSSLNDEPSEVTCLVRGEPVLSEEGRDTLEELKSDGITVTPMGKVTDRRHS